MVETKAESERILRDWIPKITIIKEAVPPQDWKARFNYPIETAPCADFYIIFQSIKDFGGVYLIECSQSNLRKKILQLSRSAEVFKSLNVHIDNYLIVLGKLNSADQRKYKLTKHPTLQYAYQIKSKAGNDIKDFLKIDGRNIMLIYKKNKNAFSG